MRDAYQFGRDQLERLALARAELNELRRRRAEAVAQRVHDEAKRDHGPEWGRAGRIQRRLIASGVSISERHVRRLLDTLTSKSELL